MATKEAINASAANNAKSDEQAINASAANNAKSDEKSQHRETPSGKRRLTKILVLVIGLVVLGGGGYVGYAKFLTPSASVEATNASKPLKKSVGHVVSMKSFIVNLAGARGKRNLKLSLAVELQKPEYQEEVDKRFSIMRDGVIILLSSKSYDDISDARGKKRLRREIISRLNSYLVVAQVRQVYFTDFVVQ